MTLIYTHSFLISSSPPLPSPPLSLGMTIGDPLLSTASVILTEDLKLVMSAAYGSKISAKHREHPQTRQVWTEGRRDGKRGVYPGSIIGATSKKD